MIDLIGKKFGKLTVIDRDFSWHDKDVRWNCKCDCGNLSSVLGTSLRGNTTFSCGCYRIESKLKHGHNRRTEPHNRTYHIWQGMKARCLNKNNEFYDYYGGRGILPCDAWLKYTSFLADMGEAPDGMTLERIDVNKGYFKENCRWATRIEQARNKRNVPFYTINNESKTLPEWCEIYKVDYEFVRLRVHRGWDVERALTVPPNATRKLIGKVKEDMKNGN